MVWNRQAPMRGVVMAENDVTAGLMILAITDLGERSHRLSAGDDGETAHIAIRWIPPPAYGFGSRLTFNRPRRARSACHRPHLACKASQIWASQPVSASSRSAVSALTERRPLTMALRHWNGTSMRFAASI